MPWLVAPWLLASAQGAQLRVEEFARLDLAGEASDAALRGDHLFVAEDGSGLTPSGLRVAHLQDPGKPAWVGNLELHPAPRTVAENEGHAYLACDWGGLVVVDVQDPARPRRLTTLPAFQLPGLAVAARYRDGYLLVATGSGAGLATVDVRDPAHPTLASRTTVASDGRATKGIQLQGDLAFVFYGVNEMAIFDIASPTAPKRLASMSTPGNPSELATLGPTTLLVDGTRTLGLDLSNPSAPKTIWSVPTLPAWVPDTRLRARVRVVGGLAWVTDEAGRVAAFDANGNVESVVTDAFGSSLRGPVLAGNERWFIAGGLRVYKRLERVTEPRLRIERFGAHDSELLRLWIGLPEGTTGVVETGTSWSLFREFATVVGDGYFREMLVGRQAGTRSAYFRLRLP